MLHTLYMESGGLLGQERCSEVVPSAVDISLWTFVALKETTIWFRKRA